MNYKPGSLEALAEIIADRARLAAPIVLDVHLFQSISIDQQCRIRRLRFLATRYNLQWLIDQEITSIDVLEQAHPDDLVSLLNLMERARECISDGVAFEDAGLVRPMKF